MLGWCQDHMKTTNRDNPPGLQQPLRPCLTLAMMDGPSLTKTCSRKATPSPYMIMVHSYCTGKAWSKSLDSVFSADVLSPDPPS